MSRILKSAGKIKDSTGYHLIKQCVETTSKYAALKTILKQNLYERTQELEAAMPAKSDYHLENENKILKQNLRRPKSGHLVGTRRCPGGRRATTLTGCCIPLLMKSSPAKRAPNVSTMFNGFHWCMELAIEFQSICSKVFCLLKVHLVGFCALLLLSPERLL